VFAPAQLSGQRQRLATFDGTAAHLWDLQDGRHLTGFRPLFAVSAAVLADNHGQSLLLTGDRTVRGFQATSSSPEYGRPVFKLADPHLGIVTSIAVAPNSPAGQYRFATAGADGSAAIWNWNSETQTIDRIRDLPSIEGRIAELSWSPDGGRLLQVAENGIVHLHAVSSPESDAIPIRIGDATDRQPGDSSYRLMCGRFSADGNSFAVAGQVAESGESIGWVYSVHGQQKPHLHCTFSGHESGGVHSLGFVPDSPYLVSGGADGAVIVWNWQPEQDDALLQAYEAYQFLGADRTTAHAAAVNMLSVSSDGNVLSASEDGIAIVWKNPFRSGDSQ
jgi:WD40 repeat protein